MGLVSAAELEAEAPLFFEHGYKVPFDMMGAGTDYLNAVMKFLTSYQQQIALTNAFCEKLKQPILLEEMTLTFQLSNGEQAHVKGFMAMDRAKLSQLPGETLADLDRSGALELIFSHLLSMRNLTESWSSGGSSREVIVLLEWSSEQQLIESGLSRSPP